MRNQTGDGRFHLLRQLAWMLLSGTAIAVFIGLSILTANTRTAHAQLNVPLINQIYCQHKCDGVLANQGRNNCGPASLAMIAEANGKTRPPGKTANQAYVRHVKTLYRGDDCNGSNRTEMDNGAKSLGLCLGTEAMDTDEIIPIVENSCTPAMAFVKAQAMPWKKHKGSYGTIDHIVVVTDFSSGNQKITLQDPLDWNDSALVVPCNATTEPNDDAAVLGDSQVTYSFADFDAAADVASSGWWGKGYGGKLGGCDGPGCGGGGAPPAATPTPTPEPFTTLSMRFSSSCSADPVMKIFYRTDDTGTTFKEKWTKEKTITADRVFHTVSIVFDSKNDKKGWRGTLRQLRIDPTTAQSCWYAFSWIGIHNSKNEIARQWTFPSGTGSGGWWSNLTITGGFIGPFWILHSIGNDSWIEHDGINLSIGR